MYISKSRFINWTRCPMYFPMELKHNPTGKDDIDAERERREEILKELADGMNESTMESAESTEEDDEKFDATPSPELEALLPYYNQVENEALRVAKKYFDGKFQNQKLFQDLKIQYKIILKCSKYQQKERKFQSELNCISHPQVGILHRSFVGNRIVYLSFMKVRVI